MTVVSPPTDLVYTLLADGTTAQETRSVETTSSNIAACHVSPTPAQANSYNLQTTIELWQDGEFKTVVDESNGNLAPCTSLPCPTAPYQWIKDMQITNKKTATLTISA